MATPFFLLKNKFSFSLKNRAYTGEGSALLCALIITIIISNTIIIIIIFIFIFIIIIAFFGFSENPTVFLGFYISCFFGKKCNFYLLREGSCLLFSARG